ncbi:MAG: GTPase Era [Kiritimatiellia bacterium]|jgi:GTP-binding protein Era
MTPKAPAPRPAPADGADAPSLNIVPHCGIVAVVGRTNAGKSTLVNRIVGEKISIVSPVVQTTRNVVRGVLTDDRGQLVLIDTPGLHKSRSTLCSIMNKRARAAAEGVDVVLLVVDGSKDPQLEDDGWMRRIAKSGTPAIILLNKADAASRLPRYQALWVDIQKESPQGTPCEPLWLQASAKTGEGVDALVETLFARLPPGPMLFDEEMLTDYPRKLAVSDIIREKFFHVLRDELPHSIGVRVDDIARKPNGVTQVRATVFVQRHNHKGIVLGPKGRTLRAITRLADKELSAFFDGPAEADLWVKVEPKWDENFFLLRQIGYA